MSYVLLRGDRSSRRRAARTSARRTTDNVVELIDEPDERRRKAEEVRVDVVDERRGDRVQRVDDFLPVLLRPQLVLAATRMTESFFCFCFLFY